MAKQISPDELESLYLDEKLSVPEIASRLGLSRQRVYERFRQNGISLRIGLSKEELTDLYQNQKLTIKGIAKQTGYSVFTVRRCLDQYEIPRPKRRTSPAPLDELKRLYLVERLSVPEIATRVGVHRNAVYARLRSNGIALRVLSKPELIHLYDNQKLTIKEIAERTGYHRRTVATYLDQYEIPRSYRRVSTPYRGGAKYSYLETLDIGDQIQVVIDSGKYPSTILKLAKELGIRIVIRKVGETIFAVYRTPPLDRETVRQMKNEGMTKTKIAEIFLATRQTIARMLR